MYDGATGVLISALTSTTAGDIVGSYYDPYSSFIKPAITVLSNGDYVVSSPYWDNGTVVDAGAVTWRSGTTGGSGVVSATNSLVGSTANDHIGCPGRISQSVKQVGDKRFLMRLPVEAVMQTAQHVVSGISSRTDARWRPGQVVVA